MSFFNTRTNFFMMMCQLHKQVAHGKATTGGNRKSFHKINDELELDAACRNWSHFPCVVHFGYSVKPIDNDGTRLRKRVYNSLLFLAKAPGTDPKTTEIQAAYDEAEKVCTDFISYLKNEMEEKGTCGNFRDIDFNNMKYDMYGPVNSNCYGWLLTWADDNYADEYDYEESAWELPENLVTEITEADIITETGSNTIS